MINPTETITDTRWRLEFLDGIQKWKLLAKYLDRDAALEDRARAERENPNTIFRLVKMTTIERVEVEE